MAGKKEKTTKAARRWKSSNNEMFASIKATLLALFKTEEFKEKNQKHFKKGTKYSHLFVWIHRLFMSSQEFDRLRFYWDGKIDE